MKISFMSFYPEYIKSNTDKIAFHEFIWNTGSGKIGSIKGVIYDLGWGTLLVKVLGLERYWLLVPVFAVSYMIFVYGFGYFLHRSHYVYRQGDVNNRLQNPQLLRTEEKVGQILEKLK